MPSVSSTHVMHRLTGVLNVVILCLAVTVPSDAAQKRKRPTETKDGTIVEIQQKGRARFLVVDIDGTQKKVPVTAKLNLQIISPGDSGFVRPGQFLTASALLSNEKLFIKSLTIRTLRKGQKAPRGGIQKAPDEQGQSTQAYDVSGVITAAQPNPDYPDHLDIALKMAGPKAPIMIEPGVAVTVSSSDPERIPADSPAEIEIVPLRGERFNVVGITIRLPDPITAAEYFGDEPADKDAPKSDDDDSATKQP